LRNPWTSLRTSRAALRQSEGVIPGTLPPTGDRIASEVEREMEDRLYRLRHVVLAPAEYHVYLHPDDYRHIEAIAPRIALDVQLCLNSLVDRLNRRSRLTELIGKRQAPIEIPPGGWAIHIKPAQNGEVGPGELGIHSRLSVPAAAKYGGGAGTTRIAQTLVSGTDRRTTVRDEPEGPVPASPAVTPHLPARPPAPATRPAGRTPGARLSYSDDRGAQTFVMSKELVKIGRGGSAHWVDLALVTTPKVSREHCRIRRDGSGRFFLQDVSAWGTFLNGTSVPKFNEGDAAAERELTDGATIRLADAVTIEFRIE
jgi:hypothetical protein